MAAGLETTTASNFVKQTDMGVVRDVNAPVGERRKRLGGEATLNKKA